MKEIYIQCLNKNHGQNKANPDLFSLLFVCLQSLNFLAAFILPPLYLGSITSNIRQTFSTWGDYGICKHQHYRTHLKMHIFIVMLCVHKCMFSHMYFRYTICVFYNCLFTEFLLSHTTLEINYRDNSKWQFYNSGVMFLSIYHIRKAIMFTIICF